jgi:hypothetical protein
MRYNSVFVVIINYFNCKWVFTGGSGTENKIQQTNSKLHKKIHQDQTKHGTQNYTNNKGHNKYNKYNANTVNKYYN